MSRSGDKAEFETGFYQYLESRCGSDKTLERLALFILGCRPDNVTPLRAYVR